MQTATVGAYCCRNLYRTFLAREQTAEGGCRPDVAYGKPGIPIEGCNPFVGYSEPGGGAVGFALPDDEAVASANSSSRAIRLTSESWAP